MRRALPLKEASVCDSGLYRRIALAMRRRVSCDDGWCHNDGFIAESSASHAERMLEVSLPLDLSELLHGEAKSGRTTYVN
jgi:hypothetical protein